MLNAASMSRIIDAALFTPVETGWGLPILFEAEPGVAKTSLLKQRCAYYGLPCEVLSPGERGEAAFGVVPVPVNGFLEALPPGWVRRFNGHSSKDKPVRGCVVVDELKSAAPALHPPLLGLTNDKRIGEHFLGWHVRVLALTNPASMAAYGQDISPANANRLIHVPWGNPTVDENCTFALEVDVFQAGRLYEQKADAKEIEDDVVEQWRAGAWAKACAYVNGFLQSRPELKNQCPQPGDPRASAAWASDRTWMHARRALASSFIHGLSEVEQSALVEGCVGAGPASELYAYIEDADLPILSNLLDGRHHYEDGAGRPIQGKKWSHKPDRIDRTAAVLSGCAALVRPAQADKRKLRGDALWKLLDRLMSTDVDHDLMVPAASAMLTAQPIVMSGSATSVLAKLEPMLRAAGITYQGGRR